MAKKPDSKPPNDQATVPSVKKPADQAELSAIDAIPKELLDQIPPDLLKQITISLSHHEVSGPVPPAAVILDYQSVPDGVAWIKGMIEREQQLAHEVTRHQMDMERHNVEMTREAARSNIIMGQRAQYYGFGSLLVILVTASFIASIPGLDSKILAGALGTPLILGVMAAFWKFAPKSTSSRRNEETQKAGE